MIANLPKLHLPNLGLLLAALAAMLFGAQPVTARVQVLPYLEYQQVLTADFNDGGEVLTYSSFAAGVDAAIDSRRFDGQISYRYERRISWDDDLADSDVHSGVAQGRYEIAKGVSLDGGALAARARADGEGPVFGLSTADDPNIAEVYSAYVGPTLSTRVGDLAVGASYRLGYVHVDDDSVVGGNLGRPVRDRYGSSTSHSATASVGMSPGRYPFGWTIGGGYVREDVDRLDQEYEGKYVRGDVVVPVSPTLAVTAGVGYEDIQSKQSDILRDANGVPIVTPGGRLIADRSKPPLLAYDQDGVIWDAGVLWRPNRRTELQARVGRRYGGTSVTGSLSHQINETMAVSAVVYDGISSFGRLVVNDLSGLPVNFNVNRNPLNNGIGGIGGCVFGDEAGTGTCFDDAFQSINTNNFRNRGASVLLSGGRGPWSMGIGAGYSHRKYLAPGVTAAGGFTMDGLIDESISISGNVGRELSRTSGVDFDAYATWFDSGVPGSESAFSTGASASYYRRLLMDRLTGYAAIGLYTTDSGTFDSTAASGLVGLRYTF